VLVQRIGNAETDQLSRAIHVKLESRLRQAGLTVVSEGHPEAYVFYDMQAMASDNLPIYTVALTLHQNASIRTWTRSSGLAGEQRFEQFCDSQFTQLADLLITDWLERSKESSEPPHGGILSDYPRRDHLTSWRAGLSDSHERAAGNEATGHRGVTSRQRT
jgi:hypothetical protein